MRRDATRIRSFGVGALVASLATIAMVAPISAATVSPYGVNLVRNPGAEAGGGGPKTCVNYAGIPRWDCQDNFQVVRYGTAGYPGHGASNAIHGGTSFFSSGPFDVVNDRCGDLHQNVPIKGHGAAIDSHHVKVTLSGYVRTKNGDAYTLQAFFEDYRNHSIGANPIGWQDYHTLGSGFFHATASRLLPAHTRNLDVYVAGLNTGGGDTCDVYFDNISVKIKYV